MIIIVHFAIDRRSLPAVVIIMGEPCNMVNFLPRDAMLSAVCRRRVSVRLSVCVCLSHSGIVSKCLNVESRK